MALLVVYYHKIEYPPRSTLTDHIYAFRAAELPCFFLNLAVRDLPGYLLREGVVDAVIFHSSLLIERTVPLRFERLQDRLASLSKLSVPRAALVQDEHQLSERVAEFVRRFEVTELFSVAPEQLWNLLYPDLGPRVTIHFTLTGYLNRSRVEAVRRLVRRDQRPIDVGYRARRPAPTLGYHGRLKELVGIKARREAESLGLTFDISNELSKTHLGMAWYGFLSRCRWVVGVEGGSDILDPDGSLNTAYERGEPLCLDSAIRGDYHALSPRHLEACLTRTGQILVEGEYGGVLKPWTHYLPLRRDLSNMKEMLELSRDESRREAMVENAYRDVVESGLYFSEQFARQVWKPLNSHSNPIRLLRWDGLMDWLSWSLVAVHARLIRPGRRRARAILSRVIGERRTAAFASFLNLD